MTSKTPLPWKKGERPDKHPLLVGARAHFEHAREGRDVHYVRPHKKNLVDILVSKEQLDRALKLASGLPSRDRWTTKKWWPSARLGIHAYAARRNVAWSHYWHERKAKELETKFASIATELKKSAPAIAALIQAEEVREAEETRKWKAQQEEWEKQRIEAARKQEEQRRRDEELKREKDFESPDRALATLARCPRLPRRDPGDRRRQARADHTRR